MSDKVDAGIAAVEAKPVEVPMRQFQVKISSTGRPGIVILPADASDGEILEFLGWVGTAVMGSYRAERAKSPMGRIIVPSGPLPPPARA